MTTGSKILIGIGVGTVLYLLKEARKKQPTVYYVGNVPFNQNAITIPPIGIYINKKEVNNSALLQHELVHWAQYQNMGLAPYYFNYVKQHVANGYDGNTMEQEARQNESDYCKINYTSCVRAGISKTVANPKFRI